MKKQTQAAPKKTGRHPMLNGPSFTLDVPAASQPGKVNYRDPPTGGSEDENYVCEVSGTVLPGDCTLSGIWVWNSDTRSTNTGQDLSEEIQSKGVLCETGHINSSGDWYFDESSSPRVPGLLGSNFGDKTNYISAVAIFEDSSGCNAPSWGVVVAPRPWTATKCMGCPINTKHPKKRAKATSASNPQHIVPSVDGDWLHYAINVEKRLNNFRLLNPEGDDFLSAAEIAVAAQVHWRPSPNRELVIRDPQGISDCRIRDSVGRHQPLMRFQGLPKFSLILWQPTVPRNTVVTSQSRTNPLEMSLDPHREIIVELNDNNQSLMDNEGTIDLWVKLPGVGG